MFIASDVSSNNSVTNFRQLLRIEPADVLEDWIDYASWRSRTSRTLRVAGIMANKTLLDNC